MPHKRLSLGGGFYVPAVLAIFTTVYLVSAIRLGPPMEDGNMTASFFPITISVLMLVALAYAMLNDIREKRGMEIDSDQENSEAGTYSKSFAGISLGAVGVIMLTTGYLLAFDRVGYVVSTLVYVLLMICLFGGSVRKNWLMKLVASLLITGAGYLLFDVFFQVRLPILWSY